MPPLASSAGRMIKAVENPALLSSSRAQINPLRLHHALHSIRSNLSGLASMRMLSQVTVL